MDTLAYLLNDWADYLRVITLLVSLYACVTLIRRWRQHNDAYNTKTKDYWYALFMWTIVGIVVPIQAMTLDRPFTPATVVITAAVLTTAKGLHTRGSWGGES